jgi:hypothetical protein
MDGIIEHKKLAILNEVKDRDMNGGIYDGLKTVITDNTLVYNEKGIRQHEGQNALNIIMTSNNSHPINISNQDRRIVAIECSDKWANPRDDDPDREQKEEANQQHFQELEDAIHSMNFYRMLTTYFVRMDLTGFNPRKFPRTAAREEMTEASANVYKLFVERNLEKFLDWRFTDHYGKAQFFTADLAYRWISGYADKYGFKVVNAAKIATKYKELGIVKTRERMSGKLAYHWKFNDEGLAMFRKQIEQLHKDQEIPEEGIELHGFCENADDRAEDEALRNDSDDLPDPDEKGDEIGDDDF